MKKSSYLSERVYDAIPSEINMESLEYWKKILKEEGLQYVKKNHLEYFFGFINNCAFSSHEKSQPRNFVKLSLNKKAFRHEGEKMVFGAFYDPFVQEANRQLRSLIEYEIEDLLSGDIPYFYFRGSKKNIYTWDGREVKDFFSKAFWEWGSCPIVKTKWLADWIYLRDTA